LRFGGVAIVSPGIFGAFAGGSAFDGATFAGARPFASAAATLLMAAPDAPHVELRGEARRAQPEVAEIETEAGQHFLNPEHLAARR
jgi:hypothetical protein